MNNKSSTFRVLLLGGGGFVRNSTFEISSNGSVSSPEIVNKVESHRFLPSGGSNRIDRASILSEKIGFQIYTG